VKVASLFAGAGGLDLGFENSGFNVVWANEYDKTIWETYQKNHKNTVLDKRSILEVKPEDIPKNIDGIIGGPPCQSWSLAGAMRGINDDRGKLFFEYLRLLKAISPKFFVVENVKGIVSKAHLSQFQNILNLFSEAGYNNFYSVLNAFDYGIPQTRERVFIVGFRKDLDIDFKFPLKIEVKNRRVLKDILNLEPSKEFDKNNLDNFNHEYLKSGFSSIFMSRNRVRNFDEPSFTIQASGRQAPLHPAFSKMKKIEKDKWIFENEESVRRFSVRECARIQTFPDDFIFHYKNINDGYKMVGNAVPPLLGQKIAEQIKLTLENKNRIIGESGNIKLKTKMEESCNLFSFEIE
jgi:DNA (cytosine-5)-methyltransferase 1